MFDVGLTELMIIGVVALVVIGPERLPKVARTVGLLLGRLQRYVGAVKADINREMQLDELKKIQQQVAEQVTSVETSVNQEMRSLETSLNTAVEPATPVNAAPAELAGPLTEPPLVAPAAENSLPPAAMADTVKT